MPSLLPVALLSLAQTGCPTLLGIDQDYGVSEAGLPDTRGPLEGGTADDHRRVDGSNDARSLRDARGSGDQVSPQGDAISASGDSSQGDGCTGACACPTPGQIRCGSTCINPSTDANHCGSCSNACTTMSPSTTTCAAARCVTTLATPAGYGAEITVDATNVYWATGAGVFKTPLAGGAIATLVPGGQPFGVAVTATTLYWTDFEGLLGRVGLDGSGAVTLVSTSLPTPPPYFVAADTTNVYWTTQTDNTTGTVTSQPLGGGSITTLASNQDLSAGIAVQNQNLYWVTIGTGAANTGAINTSPTSSAMAHAVTQANYPFDVAVDDNNLYWTSRGVPGGGTPITLGESVEPVGIAVDATNVYWADMNQSTVMRVAIGGGTPVTIASVIGAQYVAVDDTSVYCTSANPGVFRITPK